MIVCITGGTGFIGRRLVLRHLARGDEVRVISRQAPDPVLKELSVKWCEADLSNNPRIGSWLDEVDVLYHCAAEIRDVGKMKAVNVEATTKLIDIAAGKVNRWVQLSSVGVYGNKRDGLVSETSELNPVTAYESTKLEADLYVSAAAHAGAFDHVILRPSNVYGINMPNQSLFKLIAAIDKGLFFFIGKRGASANYIIVENVADALMLCGTHPLAINNAYILSDYEPLESFIKHIYEALDKQPLGLRLPESMLRVLAVPIRYISKLSISDSTIDALTNRVRYSTAKIEKELGYKHNISMRQGLRELVAFWLKNIKENNDKIS